MLITTCKKLQQFQQAASTLQLSQRMVTCSHGVTAENGQLGNGANDDSNLPVKAFENAVQVASGSNQSIAIQKDVRMGMG